MARPKDRSIELNEREKEIIKSLARNGLKVSDVAKELFFSHTNVVYHIGRIRMKTGLNPYDFYDMIKLIDMVKEREIYCSNE